MSIMNFIYDIYLLFYLQFKTYIETQLNILNNLGIYRYRKLANYPKNNDKNDENYLKNKIAIITGANSGIGLFITNEFIRLGATVIMLCRDLKKSEKIRQNIINNNLNKDEKQKEELEKRLILIRMDLSSLDSIRKCINEINQLLNIDKINYLINNAGIMMSPKSYTIDGYEQQLQINHLGHFLLTNLLLMNNDKKYLKNLQQNNEKMKIINVSSVAHLSGKIYFKDINFKNENIDKSLNEKYTPLKSYSQSKLANILFTIELSRRLKNYDNRVQTYSIHPGLVNTELGRHLNGLSKYFLNFFRRLILINTKLGSQTILYCAFNVDNPDDNGGYFSNCTRVKNMMPNAINEEDAKKLWSISCKMCGINDIEQF